MVKNWVETHWVNWESEFTATKLVKYSSEFQYSLKVAYSFPVTWYFKTLKTHDLIRNLKNRIHKWNPHNKN